MAAATGSPLDGLSAFLSVFLSSLGVDFLSSFFLSSFLGFSGFLSSSFFLSSFFFLSFLSATGVASLGSGLGLTSCLGSGLRSTLGSGLASTGRALSAVGSALTSGRSGAAASAFLAGGETSLGPSVGLPILPRMLEGVRLPPGAPSTRLIITGGVSRFTGGELGQNMISRKTARCRQRERRYEAQFIADYFPPLAAAAAAAGDRLSEESATTPSFSMPTALMRPMTSTTTP